MPALETVEVRPDEDCGSCAERLREGLGDHRGIAAVESAKSGPALLVSYDPDLCSPACLEEAAREIEGELAERFEHEILDVSGMDCYDCAQKIERAVGRMPGVTQATVNFAAARMSVELRPEQATLQGVARRVESLGYEVGSPALERGAEEASPWWRRRDLVTGIAAAWLMAALALDLLAGIDAFATVLYGLAIATGGLPIARSGIAGLAATRRPDINLLMTIAVIGAAAIGAWAEGALVVVLFSLGEMLEGRAVERARRELAGLVALAPQTARLRRPAAPGANGAGFEEVEVPVEELAVGDQIVVRPGERVPADGTVAEGASAVDQAPITGESTPVDKLAGDPVFAGTLNGEGLIVVEVSSAPGDSTLDRIARIVAEAQARKSPSERWVDSFARVYTPAVIGVAVLVAAVPPLVFGAQFSDALYSALALLILACPCALVISTPVSVVSALGRASAAGVLVKGGAHLEQAATVRAVAFDKTGTLTEGRPELVAVEALRGDEREVLTLAASLEQGSQHPLAKAIIEGALARGVRLEQVADFQALTGLGARGTVGGAEVLVGNPRMFAEAGIEPAAERALELMREAGRTAVLVVRDGEALGVLGLADRPRPEAAEAVAELRRLGVERTILLTGDNRATGQAIASELGIAEVRAELLPGQKSEAIAELGGGVAMVGDGVNDAPALAAADLGVAMGSAGSDTAIEVADVALMGDDPRKVAELVGLARWTRSVVRQNVAFSLVTKLAAAVMLALGALPLWGAVASDVGASLIVVANGLRLLRRAPGGPMQGLPLLPAAGRRAATPPPPVEAASDCCADGECASAEGVEAQSGAASAP